MDPQSFSCRRKKNVGTLTFVLPADRKCYSASSEALFETASCPGTRPLWLLKRMYCSNSALC